MSKEKKEIQTMNALGDAACYTQNIALLLAQLAVTLPVVDGKIRIDFNTAIKLLQAVWDAFKLSARECAGKEIEVPSSGFWNIARALLSIWFKL